MRNQYVFGAVIGSIILIVGLYIGAVYFGTQVSQIYTASPVGTTFSNAKVAQINFSLTSNTATTTSILNSDAFDRIVTDTFGYCSGTGSSFTPVTGAGLASLIFRAATTSTSAPVSFTNTNYTMFNNVSTSTPDSYFASTTMAVGTFGRVWASGSFMTFASNATNTASCTVGLHYIGS